MSYKDPEEKKRKDKEYRDRPENKLRMKAYGKKYQKENKEKRRLQNNAWQRKNRVKLNAKFREYKKRLGETYTINERKSYLKRNYGITLEDFKKMSEEQGGVCAICHQPEVGMELSVDHCHKTGVIRGLLCARCNRSIGMMEDSIELLANAIGYIEKERLSNENIVPVHRIG